MLKLLTFIGKTKVRDHSMRILASESHTPKAVKYGHFVGALQLILQK
jgi:hypothetical protein